MDFSFVKCGVYLIIETYNLSEVFLGRCEYIDTTTSQFIALEDVTELRSLYEYTSQLMLSLNEIKSIKLLPVTEAEGQRSGAAPHIDYCHLSLAQLRQVKEQLQSLVYVVGCDRSYHQALADIKREDVVALLVEPSTYGQYCRSGVIAVATDSAAYIFDMVALGRVFRDFKEVLEAQRPGKVVHLSQLVADQLWHRQQVKLEGIFDTSVAYSKLFGSEVSATGPNASLIELAGKCFGLPKAFFEYLPTIWGAGTAFDVRGTDYDPYRRPFSSNQKHYVARLAIFQLKLYYWLRDEHKRSQSD